MLAKRTEFLQITKKVGCAGEMEYGQEYLSKHLLAKLDYRNTDYCPSLLPIPNHIGFWWECWFLSSPPPSFSFSCQHLPNIKVLSNQQVGGVLDELYDYLYISCIL